MKGIKKFIVILIIGLIIVGIAGCQSSLQQKKAATEKEESSTDKLHSDAQLLDGSELDMSKLGENEKYVVARTIYKDLETNEKSLDEIYRYNKYGKKKKKIDYNDGKIIGKCFWRYNQDGDLVKKIDKDDNYTQISYYNENDQLTKFITKNDVGNIIGGSTYKYWDNNNLKYKKEFGGSQKEIFYNKKGIPKRGLIKKKNKKINLRYKVKYHPNGKRKRMVKKKIHKGEVLSLAITIYNRKGKKVKLLDYNIQSNKKKLEATYEWEYGDRGNKTKVVIKNKNGKVEEKKEYKYDEKERKREEKRYLVNKNKKLEVWSWITYNYDKFGHFISKKIKNKNGEVVVILKNKFKKIKEGKN